MEIRWNRNGKEFYLHTVVARRSRLFLSVVPIILMPRRLEGSIGGGFKVLGSGLGGVRGGGVMGTTLVEVETRFWGSRELLKCLENLERRQVESPL